MYGGLIAIITILIISVVAIATYLITIESINTKAYKAFCYAKYIDNSTNNYTAIEGSLKDLTESDSPVST